MASIVIYESQRELRDLLSLILEQAGHTVLISERLDDLPRLVHDSDLVLVDTPDPSLEGASLLLARLCNQLRQSAPVILLTSWNQTDEDLLTLGCSDVLRMPFDIEEFYALIALHLKPLQ